MYRQMSGLKNAHEHLCEATTSRISNTPAVTLALSYVPPGSRPNMSPILPASIISVFASTRQPRSKRRQRIFAQQAFRLLSRDHIQSTHQTMSPHSLKTLMACDSKWPTTEKTEGSAMTIGTQQRAKPVQSGNAPQSCDSRCSPRFALRPVAT
jgi:hypothetical protein